MPAGYGWIRIPNVLPPTSAAAKLYTTFPVLNGQVLPAPELDHPIDRKFTGRLIALPSAAVPLPGPAPNRTP